MGSDGATFGRVEHLLEEGAEDGWRDLRPVEVAGVEERGPHGRVEGGEVEPFAEECAIDVGKRLQGLIEVKLA